MEWTYNRVSSNTDFGRFFDNYRENDVEIGEVFDSKKSEIFEKRYYFDENMKLIRYTDENKKNIENVQKLKEIEKEILNEYFRIKNRN